MINLVFFIYLFTHPEQRLNLSVELGNKSICHDHLSCSSFNVSLAEEG